MSELRNVDGTENENSVPFCKRMTTGWHDRARDRTSVGFYTSIVLHRCKIMQLALSQDRNKCTAMERGVQCTM